MITALRQLLKDSARANDREVLSDGRLSQGQAGRFFGIYEELGLGGFWSTDQCGAITYITNLPSLKASPGQNLTGQSFFDIFELSDNASEAGVALQILMAKPDRFDRVVFKSSIANVERLWSVSGVPRLTSDGEFAGFAGHLCEITNERSAIEAVNELAKKDALTGLLNRRELNARLADCITGRIESGEGCALILMDLDRFKQVNDTLGHSAGDQILLEVSERLKALVTPDQMISRIGGDEFQILCPQCRDRSLLAAQAEAIIADLSKPYHVHGQRCTIGVSIGIALSPFDGASVEELVRNADLALYSSKGRGGGSFRFFSEELLKAAEDRRKLEEDLRDALANNELELRYQPIVDAKTKNVVGAETLLRWKHEKLGYISPSVFISVAEAAGIIEEIGAMVLTQACHDASMWPQPLRVAVNISPIQFANPKFSKVVQDALESSGLDPDRLELETTETVLLEESYETQVMFRSLQRIGVRFALDDFGKGYSSLGCLSDAPYNNIKIDQSFVQGATRSNPRNKSIIGTIVALASSIGMETTAEGIETIEQFDMVKTLGVGRVQGFAFSRPISNAEMIEGLVGSTWRIEPIGYSIDRDSRQKVHRRIGVIYSDRYYWVKLRDLSKTGAQIAGLRSLPLGTKLTLDFGGGQLCPARVVQLTHNQGVGVSFEEELIDNGIGELCTGVRVPVSQLRLAGFPIFFGEYAPDSASDHAPRRVSLPSFGSR